MMRNKIMSKCLKTAHFSVCNTSSIQKTKSKVFLIFNLIAIGVFFIMFSILFASLSSADLYLNSKVGSIYFNTTGIARASIGPGGNFSVNTSDLFVNNNLGRVGIGTSIPGGKLHIVDAVQQTAFTGTTLGQLSVKGTTANGDYSALTFISSAAYPGAKIGYEQTAN